MSKKLEKRSKGRKKKIQVLAVGSEAEHYWGNCFKKVVGNQEGKGDPRRLPYDVLQDECLTKSFL